MRADVIVVGGGPAGLLTAYEVASAGFEVVVLEEHKSIGRPSHCAGLVSVKGLRRLGIRVPSKVIINDKILCATFVSPSGYRFDIGRGETQAYVIDRELFDRYLADLAEKKGVTVLTEHKVTDVRTSNQGRIRVSFKSTRGVIEAEAKCVVIAEGVSCRLSRRLGFAVPRVRLPAVQHDIEGGDANIDTVELHFGRRVAPGFFAWVIPLKSDTVRVGVAAYNFPRKRLKKFLIRRFRGSRFKILRKMGGRVITSGPVRRCVRGGVIIVGDTAGHVKPTTGGGVILGGICARIAGRTVAGFLEKNATDPRVLLSYDATWRRVLGREFSAMKMVRFLLNALTDKILDNLFKNMEFFHVDALLERYGDMDFQREVILRGMTSVRVLALALRSLIP